MTSNVPAVLVTEALWTTDGARLSEVMAESARALVLKPDQAPQAQELADVRAAFLSTDLIGPRNKQAPHAGLAQFGAVVERCTGLQWMHVCSAGTDRPLLQTAMRRGVTVTSSTGANAEAVAQCAIAGMLALHLGVAHWVRSQDARRWAPHAPEAAPRDLTGQHAVVIGLGAIGSRVARLCQALGLHVTGLRRQRQLHPACAAVGTLADLREAAASADWLFLCCPLSSATRSLVDADLLSRLPSHARLVNVSRGEVVVEADLFAALQRGALGGVYADVFEQEPLPEDSPWWTLPNTVLSSHVAGLTQGLPARTRDLFLANLERWLAGRELLNVGRPL
ncbi:D-2-hydroxyacid dehydrogenase [Rubrivivax sp. RP6-9]|uniref:D-2-hydroxyacid dehydrogenase n=1 Tax=Rubrivivax sp. RP6-9 TaxID=3415750 RepID=UPI003CC6AC00